MLHISLPGTSCKGWRRSLDGPGISVGVGRAGPLAPASCVPACRAVPSAGASVKCSATTTGRGAFSCVRSGSACAGDATCRRATPACSEDGEAAAACRRARRRLHDVDSGEAGLHVGGSGWQVSMMLKLPPLRGGVD
eukprot:287229-Chlamydomonas_euryale.AAC.6